MICPRCGRYKRFGKWLPTDEDFIDAVLECKEFKPNRKCLCDDCEKEEKDGYLGDTGFFDSTGLSDL